MKNLEMSDFTESDSSYLEKGNDMVRKREIVKSHNEYNSRPMKKGSEQFSSEVNVKLTKREKKSYVFHNAKALME